MIPHEMRPDSPVDAPSEPCDPCRHSRGNLKFWTQLLIRTWARAANAEESQGVPSDSLGDCTSLRPHKPVPEIPVVIRKESRPNS